MAILIIWYIHYLTKLQLYSKFHDNPSKEIVLTMSSYFLLSKDPLLGTASFSMFGLLGAVIQVILILYPFNINWFYKFTWNALLLM